MFRVLLVDDEYYIREMFKSAIDWGAEGFAIVGEATGSKQALNLVETLSPDLVLLDINLPDADGFTFAGEIEQMADRPEIIIITGYDRFEYAKKAITFNVHDYLLKPIADLELLNSVQAVRKKIIEKQKNQRMVHHLTEDIYTLMSMVDQKEVLQLQSPKPEEAQDANYIVQKAKQYVKENIHNHELSVENISQALFINMSYLSHVFKKDSGTGLHEFIQTQRMEKAYEMILRTEKNLDEISACVGFQNPTYFGKRLKQHYGMSFSKIRGMWNKYVK
jgi:YesN/AraC family two-component response regulator